VRSLCCMTSNAISQRPVLVQSVSVQVQSSMILISAGRKNYYSRVVLKRLEQFEKQLTIAPARKRVGEFRHDPCGCKKGPIKMAREFQTGFMPLVLGIE